LLALFFPATLFAASPTATVNVQKVLVQRFDGWGVSLCWWAHVMGGYTNREEIADLAFKELGLNIVRYNIGGGENPGRTNTMQLRARMPGFEPQPGVWDWEADANQRWMLQAAVARGADHVIAFANSPPYWMTKSGSVTGSPGGTNDNLLPQFEASFAEYMATVVSNLTILDHVKFDFVTPMNEPAAYWWKLDGHQEGDHMSVAQQARMINLLRAALDRHGVSAGIMASEDNDEANTVKAISAYDKATLGNVSGITTHTYNANAPRKLRKLAGKTGKPLWVSEYGDRDPSGLQLARRIRDDIAGLHAQAWTHWQFADGGGWGLISHRLYDEDGSYRIAKKFYIFAQFSRFIRPGCQIVDVNNDDALAAFDAGRRRIILVAVNDRTDSCTNVFQIAGIKTTTGTTTVYRTSTDENLAPLPPVPIRDNKFTATLPARSVTTFVIADAILSN
jgi:O-glycosyl hydrolase